MESSSGRPLRLLSLVEANCVTGVAKALIEFCREAGSSAAEAQSAPVHPFVVSFERSGQSFRDEPQDTFEQTLRSIGVLHEKIPERFRLDTRVVPHLREAVRRFRPDIIESHSVKSHAVVWSSGLWRQFPWLAYHHGYTKPDAKMRLYNFADRLTLRAADRVITVASAFIPELLGRGVRPGQLFVVHNALGAAAWPKRWDRTVARQALSIGQSTAVVLSLGRLSFEKGLADLIRAFAVLTSRRSKDAMLVIAGDGSEKKRLESLAQRLGVAEQIRFAGHVLDPSPYYAAANVFVIPSHSEGSPYVLLEALAARVPTVATRVGGIPEMVSDGVTALLVPPGDPHSMTHAIELVLHDCLLAERLALNGERHVAAKFAARLRAERLLGMFSTVLEERSKQTRNIR